jgi:hypothetical protein
MKPCDIELPYVTRAAFDCDVNDDSPRPRRGKRAEASNKDDDNASSSSKVDVVENVDDIKKFEREIRNNSRFFLQIINFHTIKNLFEVLGNIVGNVKWEFREKVIKMNSINQKQCIIVYVKLFAGDDKFEYKFQENSDIVMNMKSFFAQTMKSNKKKDIISMYVTKESPTDLNVVYNNRTYNQATRIKYFSLRQEVITVPTYSYPVFTYEFYFTLKTTELHGRIRQRQKSDVFELAVSRNKIRLISDRKISCTREDVLWESKTSVVFSKNKKNVDTFFKNENELFFGPFSCRKINSLYKLHHSSSNVTVLLNSEKRKTLTMRYHVGDIGELNVVFAQESDPIT